MLYIKDAIMFLCSIFKEYWYFIIGIIALCFLLPIFIKHLYAFVSRMAFVARLSSVCRQKGATLKFEKLPIWSLLKNHKFFDMRITLPNIDKAYNVKFFPKIPLRRIVVLSELGKAYISKATVQTYIGKKGGLPGGSPTTLNYSETRSCEISLSLPPTTDKAQSILLFQPSAFDVRVAGENVDSEGNYCGYRIFDDEEFINYLFRI